MQRMDFKFNLLDGIYEVGVLVFRDEEYLEIKKIERKESFWKIFY